MFSSAAQHIIDAGIVWDNHVCMPLRPLDTTFLPQLERHRLAGFNAVTLNVGFGDNSIEDHLVMLAHLRHWLSERADRYVLAHGVDDIVRAKSTKRLAVLFDIEGMRAIGAQLSLIQLYYDLGVRWMLVAYNRNNQAGGGCQDEDGGLSGFGRNAIDEMQRVGMIVCCSHTGYRTAREVIDHCANPVIFSHSNPRALKDHPRNIPDDLIRACATRGGLIGINGIGIFLGDNDNSVEAIVRHIDHVVTLVGEDHVGLGLDYVFDRRELDGWLKTMRATFPRGLGYQAGMRMVAPEKLPEIVDALLALGYRQASIAKILGGNLLRIAQAVWR